MENIAIRFDNVSKLYRLGMVGTGTLSHDLNRWWKTFVLRQEDPYLKIGETNDRSKKGETDYVWALKDITFDVEQGDVVGIIGKNGAGKSTLLKLLSRITSPTVGTIKASGRIASLLEVGTGFHPEMTGRENIYMNGTIMGMTRREIARKFDDIVDFAGVARYVDTPTKRYSSGMTVRLGFAVAAFLEPDILVVDEVLAVGDAEFQRKAIGKMQEVSRNSSRTVLFVSHNMASVKALCNKGIVLDNGSITYNGNCEDAINFYLADGNSEDSSLIKDKVKWVKSWLKIDKITINGIENSCPKIASGQKTMNVVIEGQTSEDFSTDLMMLIKTKEEVPLCMLADGHVKGSLMHIKKGEFKIEKEVILPKYISCGDCVIDLFLHHPGIEWQMKARSCAQIHFDGYAEEYGHVLNMNDGGFFGMETI